MKSKIIVWLCAICLVFGMYKLCTIPNNQELYTKEDATLIIKEKEISQGIDELVYTSYQFYFKFCDGRYIKKELTLYEFKTLEIGEDYGITYRNDKPDYTGWYLLLVTLSLLIGCYYIVNSDESEDKDKSGWDHY